MESAAPATTRHAGGAEPTTADAPDTGHAQAQAQSAAPIPQVGKTSILPGPLRNRIDSRTAKYERAVARLSDDTKLQQALLGQDPDMDGRMSGRMTRAFQQEAKKRAQSGQWNPQPP
ncbi:hypothetical protein ACFSUI_23920 [Ralstonia solanacearum]